MQNECKHESETSNTQATGPPTPGCANNELARPRLPQHAGMFLKSLRYRVNINNRCGMHVSRHVLSPPKLFPDIFVAKMQQGWGKAFCFVSFVRARGLVA